MARINNTTAYPQDATVTIEDFLIGSDADDSSATKTYTLESILDLFAAEVGEITLEGYDDSGTRAGGDLIVQLGDYDASTNGTKITITDSTSTVDVDGFFSITGNNATGMFSGNGLTTAQFYTLPDQTGTMALVEDIPTTVGDVFKTGTPVNNQLAIWTDDETIEGDPAVVIENDGVFRRLTLGVDDTTAGYIRLYGHSGVAANSGIQMYNNADQDSNVESWTLFPVFGGGSAGNFVIQASGTVSGEALNIDDATLGITAPNMSTADIDALGNSALVTKEYLDTNTTDTSEWSTYTGTRAGGNIAVTLGDYDESGTGTAVEITDAARSIRMGDIQESYNGVILQIDDANSNINMFTPIGDVQLHCQGFQLSITGESTPTVGQILTVKSEAAGMADMTWSDQPYDNTGYIVSGLPTGAQGDRTYVTDANATTFMSIVAGGGSNIVPVFHNGTNWVIG